MNRLRDLGRRALVPALSVITAFIFGAVVIVLTDLENLARLPTDPVGAILGALPQRGQPDGEHVQAIEQVFAEAVFADRLFEIAMRRRDDAQREARRGFIPVSDLTTARALKAPLPGGLTAGLDQEHEHGSAQHDDAERGKEGREHQRLGQQRADDGGEELAPFERHEAGLVLTGGLLPAAIFILKDFTDTTPTSYEESARVFGASPFQILKDVVVPLVRPGMAVIAVWTLVNVWGNFLIPFILLRDPNLAPASVVTYSFYTEGGQADLRLLSAFSLLYSVPVVVMYLFVQRRYGFRFYGGIKR